MATYFTDDFADFATDWTERWNTAGTWSVSSGNLVVPAGASNDWRGLSWNDIDGDADRANVEILAKFVTPASITINQPYPFFLRGAGADESATNYSVYISTSAFRIYYCSGSDTPTQVATVAGTFAGSTTYWIRFRVNGSDLKARIWADGGGEPGTWNIETTDSNVTAAGWVGPTQYNATGTWTVYQFGVGTNGDTAPSSAVSAASFGFRPQFPHSILNF